MHHAGLRLTSPTWSSQCNPSRFMHTTASIHVPMIHSSLLQSMGSSMTCLAHAYQSRLIYHPCMRGSTFALGSSIHHLSRVDAPANPLHPSWCSFILHACFHMNHGWTYLIQPYLLPQSYTFPVHRRRCSSNAIWQCAKEKLQSEIKEKVMAQ
jgi:hypothetical protein